MKIKTLIVTAALFLTSIFSFSQQITFSDLDTYAKIFDLDCPTMIDQDTRLDRCIAIPTVDGSLLILFDYTLVNYTKSSLINTFGSIEKVQSIMEVNLLNNMKSNESMDVLKQNKISFIYKYSDMYSIYLFHVIIEPKDYTNYY